MKESKKIFTSSYDNVKKFPGNMRLISISGDKGKAVGFEGNSYSLLAPKYSFWKEWHDNYYNKKPLLESVSFYIENYYNSVLKHLKAEQVVNDLKNNDILLCYEETGEFCHRYIVGEWLNNAGFNVCELDKNFKEVQYPSYISEILKNVIGKSFKK